VNARSALSSMEAQAGLGLQVIGELSALIRFDRPIRIAGDDDLNSARLKQRTQPHAQCESEGLLQLSICQASARIVAAMSRIQHHNKARLRRRRGRLRKGRLRGNYDEREGPRHANSTKTLDAE